MILGKTLIKNLAPFFGESDVGYGCSGACSET
jgi:hypothetical protein